MLNVQMNCECMCEAQNPIGSAVDLDDLHNESIKQIRA